MGPGVNAHFIVEYNYFDYLRSGKVVEYFDTSANPAIVWSKGNNKTVSRSRFDSSSDKPWEPAYNYKLDSLSQLPTIIPAQAGPKLVFYK